MEYCRGDPGGRPGNQSDYIPPRSATSCWPRIPLPPPWKLVFDYLLPLRHAHIIHKEGGGILRPRGGLRAEAERHVLPGVLREEATCIKSDLLPALRGISVTRALHLSDSITTAVQHADRKGIIAAL